MVSELPTPIPEPGEALIRVLQAGICNTDLEIMAGYLGFEGVLGHEFVGVVEQDHGAGLVGKRVVGEINLPCYRCERCLSGLSNHCSSMRALGMRQKDGCFAEYLTLPVTNLHVVSDRISNDEAVFVEPAAAAVRIAEQHHLRPSEPVLVLGDGKLGLCVALVLDALGLEVEVLGRNPEKLARLHEFGVGTYCVSREDGAVLAYHPGGGGSEAGPERRLRDIPVVVEVTGSQSGLETAMKYLRPEGKLILKSTVAGAAALNLSPAVVNELQLLGSRCGPFEPVLRLMERGRLSLSGLISKKFSLLEGEEAFAQAQERGVLKVVLHNE
ncbi:MAG: alcohol dehydrogenase [Spirochaetaceae bacterium]|nr:MAG: alcohol dehydrogenase [Spirochaetaceae bacterium]